MVVGFVLAICDDARRTHPAGQALGGGVGYLASVASVPVWCWVGLGVGGIAVGR